MPEQDVQVQLKQIFRMKKSFDAAGIWTLDKSLCFLSLKPKWLEVLLLLALDLKSILWSARFMDDLNCWALQPETACHVPCPFRGLQKVILKEC